MVRLMRGRVLVCICSAVLLWAGSAAASLEESEVASRLALDATKFLDQLLGPGRAQVLVSVEGESSEIQTQTEVLTPILQSEDKTDKTLPGYDDSEARSKIDYYQKDIEKAARRQSFRIKRVRVSTVLDESLSEAKVNTVRRVLPELLRLDEERGDDLSVLRAKLIPTWRRAFLTPVGMRVLLIGLAALLTVIFMFLMGMRTASAIAAGLSAEIAKARLEGPGGAFPAETLPAGGEFPELSAGGLPGPGAENAEDGAENRQLLGQRFDFLSSCEPIELADLLLKETPDDLAIFFANISHSHPDLASRVFSILPSNLQAAASQSLLKLDMADPDRLSMLENRLKTAVEFGIRGHERLGSILSRMPAEERNTLLGELMSRDPKSAQDVEKTLFPFEAIADFKPEELRRLIVTISYEEWGTALRGVPEELLQRILAELPAGTRNLVSDSAASPQPKEKVLEARSKILSQVSALAGKGQILLRKEDASSEMI